MREFLAWYRHARSWGKPVRASLVYARAQAFQSNKVDPGGAINTPGSERKSEFR